MRKIIVKIQYAIWAANRISKPKLGDLVDYNGLECSLVQGVQNPYWDLLEMSDENLKKDKREIIKRVHVSDFKIRNSIKRKLWSFRESYKFQIQNWLLIDTYHKPLFSPISYKN